DGQAPQPRPETASPATQGRTRRRIGASGRSSNGQGGSRDCPKVGGHRSPAARGTGRRQVSIPSSMRAGRAVDKRLLQQTGMSAPPIQRSGGAKEVTWWGRHSCLPASHAAAAIDDEHLAGHIRRGVRGEEDRRSDNVVGLTVPAQWGAATEGGGRLRTSGGGGGGTH